MPGDCFEIMKYPVARLPKIVTPLTNFGCQTADFAVLMRRMGSDETIKNTRQSRSRPSILRILSCAFQSLAQLLLCIYQHAPGVLTSGLAGVVGSHSRMARQKLTQKEFQHEKRSKRFYPDRIDDRSRNYRYSGCGGDS